MIARLLVLFGALLLTACAAVTEPLGIADPLGIPQPFKGSGNQEILAEVLSERDVYVAPVAGLDPARDAALRRAIVEAARELDVVASDTVPLAGALVLSGAASAAGIAFGLADGERSLDSFEAGGDDAAIAATAAGRLAAAMSRGAEATAGPAGAVTTRAAPLRAVVAIRLADGDPKPGNALGRAMASELRGLGVAIEQGAKSPFVLEVRLAFGEERNGTIRVLIRWTLIHPNGREIGKVDQDNSLPAEEVRKRWVTQAQGAAGAAAPEIVQLIAGAMAGG
jgi:hypothetical protein